jgi:hypothetical protein
MSIPAEIAALLSTPASEIKPPAPLPAGPYIGTVNAYEFKTSAQKQTPFVRYTVNLSGPAPGNDADLSEIEFPRQLRMDFYLTPTSLFRLTDFHVKVLGLPETNTVQENITLAIGRSAVFNVVLKASSKPNDSTLYPEISGAAAL